MVVAATSSAKRSSGDELNSDEAVVLSLFAVWRTPACSTGQKGGWLVGGCGVCFVMAVHTAYGRTDDGVLSWRCVYWLFALIGFPPMSPCT